MRLLVVSFAFPPFNSIGGVRVGKTVKFLRRFGHDVRVVTARDQPFPPTLALEIPQDAVIYSKWLNVRKGTQRGTFGARVAPAQNNHRVASLRSIIKRSFARAFKALFDFPDANIGWVPSAVRASARLFKTWTPDLILASSPPPSSLIVAHRLFRKFGIPWVADLRDLWVDHPYYDQPDWRRFLERWLEGRVLSSASGLVTVSAPLAQTLKARYGKEAAVVLNGFDAEDYPHNARAPSNTGLLRILYTGMIYPGKRDPSPLFEALGKLGEAKEKVRVVFYGFFLESVKQAARRYDAESLVEINEPVSYKDSLRMQTEADILLLLLWSGATERGVYTGKLFEYLGARRPLLAIGGAATVAADLIRNRSAGVVLDDPSRIAAQLKAWIRQKEEGGIPPLKDAVVAGVSREEQTMILEEYLSGVWRASGNCGAPGMAS